MALPMFKFILLAIALIVIYFSCSPKSLDPTLTTPTPTSPTSEANTALNLVGNWTRGCIVTTYDSNNNPIKWAKNDFTISSNLATETVITYSSSNCATVNKILETKVTASLTVGNKSTISEYNNIAFQIVQYTVTPHTSSLTTSYNTGGYTSTCGSAIGYCGFTNWSVGTTKDVTGLNHCQSGCVYPSMGALKYSIFSLGNFSGGSIMLLNSFPINALKFGGTNSADAGPISLANSSSAPTTVNLDLPYTGP